MTFSKFSIKRSDRPYRKLYRKEREKMKTINIEERERILSMPYISADGYYKCLPVGVVQARKIFNQDLQDIVNDGIPVFNTRPRVIPTSYFINKYIGRRKA